MATLHACDSCGRGVTARSLLWRLWSAPAERRLRGPDEVADDWELCDSCMSQVRAVLDGDSHHPCDVARCGRCGRSEASRIMLWQLRSAPVEHGRLDGNEVSEGWVLCEGCLDAVRASISPDTIGGHDEPQRIDRHDR